MPDRLQCPQLQRYHAGYRSTPGRGDTRYSTIKWKYYSIGVNIYFSHIMQELGVVAPVVSNKLQQFLK